jgi:hypothetical protein
MGVAKIETNSPFFPSPSLTNVLQLCPESEHPNSEQFLKVTGFRGDGGCSLCGLTTGVQSAKSRV